MGDVIRKRQLKPGEIVRTITGGITLFFQHTPAKCDVCEQEGFVLVQIQDEHGEMFDEAISVFFCKAHYEQFRRELLFALRIPGTSHQSPVTGESKRPR